MCLTIQVHILHDPCLGQTGFLFASVDKLRHVASSLDAAWEFE